MRNKADSRRSALINVLACVGLWALIPVVSKTGQADLDSHQFLFWSSIVSFLALGGVSVATRSVAAVKSWRPGDWLRAAGLGFLGTYLYYILLYFGYAEARGLEVLVLQYTWPVFVVIFGIIILKEKLSWRRGAAVLLGFLGVFLVLTGGDLKDIHLNNVRVDLLVLTGALAFGLFSVLSKRLAREPYGLNTVYFLTATVASFVSMLIFSNFTWPTSAALLPIIINGLLVNGFSYIFWINALRKADASFVAPFVFLTPVLSAFYLVVFFREPVLPVYLVGLGAVVLGGLLNRE